MGFARARKPNTHPYITSSGQERERKKETDRKTECEEDKKNVCTCKREREIQGYRKK